MRLRHLHGASISFTALFTIFAIPLLSLPHFHHFCHTFTIFATSSPSLPRLHHLCHTLTIPAPSPIYQPLLRYLCHIFHHLRLIFAIFATYSPSLSHIQHLCRISTISVASSPNLPHPSPYLHYAAVSLNHSLHHLLYISRPSFYDTLHYLCYWLSHYSNTKPHKLIFSACSLKYS
jgi:hypothetical protein